ncbi:hypothetical protein M407DRAFT_12313 [Tulasnella calospora MUT 4182]|uniref:D-alanine--D-alanine ligase C-terminal domain-containing protein n=1 Tax=Tulasnella calospora MUT 4182 TaxID=1051891 RepID=A0A0C3L7N3_9AGAM|nr:hypothetical protein M407DRAFT_12313 [Tulasnella calospora MUT 4182]
MFDEKTDNLAKGLTYKECSIYESDENIELDAETMRKLGYEVDLVGNLEAAVKRLASDPLPDWDDWIQGHAGGPAAGPAGRFPWNVPSLDSGYSDERSPAQSAINSSPYVHALQTYPLFVKPSYDGGSRKIGTVNKVISPADLEPAVNSLRQQFPDQEVLIEPFLSSAEMTITIIGTGPGVHVIGAREMSWPKGNQWEDQDYYSFERKTGAEEAWSDYSHPSLTDPRIMKARAPSTQLALHPSSTAHSRNHTQLVLYLWIL